MKIRSNGLSLDTKVEDENGNVIPAIIKAVWKTSVNTDKCEVVIDKIKFGKEDEIIYPSKEL